MAGEIWSDPFREASKLAGRSKCVNQEATKVIARVNGLREFWECRAGLLSAKAMSTSLLWDLSIYDPLVVEDGMPGRNGQRKPGTARGSPRRSHSEGIAYKPPCGEIAMCLRAGRMGSVK